MKNFYKFFMTLIAFAVVGVAQATDYVPEDALDGIPEEGVSFALQVQNGSESGLYLRGVGASTKIDDECIYHLEYVDLDAQGRQRVYLVQESTGEYLKYMRVDDGLDGNDMWGYEQNCWYTSNVDEAFLLSVEVQENGTLKFWSQDGTNPSGTPTYFGMWSKIPSLGPWISGDWLAFTYIEQLPYEKLFSYVEDNYPGGIEGMYVVGDAPGNVSQEAYDALEAAYEAARALLEKDMDAVTEEEAQSAIAALEAAQQLINASVVPVKAGYYYITNTLYPSQGAYVEGSEIYHDTVDTEAEATVDQSRFIWEIIPADTEAETPTYYVRNYYTNTYAGAGASGTVPSVEAPVEYLIRTRLSLVGEGAGFAFSPKANPARSWNRNGGNTKGTTVFWAAYGSDYNNSYWYLTAVSEEDIARLADAVAQDRLNKELTTLTQQAQGTLNSATYYTSAATKDGLFPNALGAGSEEYQADGILVSDDQLSTNAPEANEGAPQGYTSQMVDGQNNTYFHSTWSSTNEHSQDPVLDIDLLKEYNALEAKLEIRVSNNAPHTQGRPHTIVYYGTNDQSLLLPKTNVLAEAGVADYEGWNELGTTTIESYPYANAEGAANVVALTGLPFGDQNYRYLRLRFVDNNAGANGGWAFVCISELRLYEATVDPKSPINNVEEAVTAALKAQIASAQAQLAAGTATREQIDALQAAYDAFVAQCPDPALLLAAVSDAKNVLEGAPVGAGLGYYPQTAVDAFKAVIDEVEATYAGDMSLAQISEGRAKLAEATTTFRLSLNMPEEGKIYTITAGTSVENTHGGYVRAQNNSRTATVQWTKDDVDPSVDLYCVWEVVKAEGFNLTLRNVGTGLYLNDQDVLSGIVTQTDSVNAREVISANVGGMFNIRINSAGAEQAKYLNAQPASSGTVGSIVAWTSFANGNDNSAFIFEEAELSRRGESEIKVSANQKQIISLPYAIVADENMYAVAGANAEATEVYANSIEGETIPAGAAFIYNETAGETVAYVYPVDEFPFAYSQENKLANGLQAVLEGGEIPVGVGYFQGASAYVSTPQLHSLGANSGYIPVSATKNVIDGGDLTIKFSQGASLNGIGTIEAAGAGAGKIYDLSGRRVEKAQKGLYIVDGKKVLVK